MTTSSPLSDRCWDLITGHAGSNVRGSFLFMSGETLQHLQTQRDQASPPEFMYGVRIMIDDTLPAETIELHPFQSRPYPR